MPKLKVRKGMPSVQLAKEEFSKRARERFYDPTFTMVTAEIDRIIDVAWKNYTESHKSPRTRRAGRGFNDPEFLLPIEWLETRKAIEQAEKRQKNPRSNSRILLINGSTRSDQTCPGEMSKTFRLAKIAEEVIVNEKGFESDFLDLSRLASEYGRIIYPCKACVSTAMPLCHWPCSCEQPQLDLLLCLRRRGQYPTQNGLAENEIHVGDGRGVHQRTSSGFWSTAGTPG
ncbi:MAG TPA: hypothetical protein VFQ43_21645 [Nitrososphaera sp.]|nr:hypothetical protein [Nitrososphaera sp.]